MTQGNWSLDPKLNLGSRLSAKLHFALVDFDHTRRAKDAVPRQIGCFFARFPRQWLVHGQESTCIRDLITDRPGFQISSHKRRKPAILPRASSAPTPDSANSFPRTPNRNPETHDGAEAASIKGFAGQVWALHAALYDPVWDLCKTFLPRNFRA